MKCCDGVCFANTSSWTRARPAGLTSVLQDARAGVTKKGADTTLSAGPSSKSRRALGAQLRFEGPRTP